MIVLIAAEGMLPVHVATCLQDQGTPWVLCGLEGYVPHADMPKGSPTPQIFRIETLGSFIADLKAQGATQVCLAGKGARPPIDPTKIDAATMPLVPRMMQALQLGDDAALRAVLGFFEEAGIMPVAAHELAQWLLPPEGYLVGQPNKQDQTDILRAQEVHHALSQVDVGQGVVVAKGQVLAVEALPGTDWMLRSLALPKPVTAPTPAPNDGDPLEWAFGGVSDWLTGPGAGTTGPTTSTAPPDFARPPGGIFFKAPKVGQDRRVDLPVIGVDTIRNAAAAGLNGIVIEAGGVMVFDPDACRDAAGALGLFLWVRPAQATG